MGRLGGLAHGAQQARLVQPAPLASGPQVSLAPRALQGPLAFLVLGVLQGWASRVKLGQVVLPAALARLALPELLVPRA